MKRLAFALLALALPAVVCASTERGAARAPYTAFARTALAGDAHPELWLAQRAITREWGLSEDSVYAEVEVSGWKSEGGALAASALLPGTGQLYLGEGSGWLYLLAEAGGWAGMAWLDHKADQWRDRAANFVGDPYDSTSVFSFARLERETAVDPSRLQTLWASDRDGFYQALVSDPTLQAGFVSSGSAGYLGYTDRRDRSDRALRHSRMAQAAVWANHLISAWDALRTARLHNLPLQRDLGLQLGARWNRKGPSLRAALQRRF